VAAGLLRTDLARVYLEANSGDNILNATGNRYMKNGTIITTAQAKWGCLEGNAVFVAAVGVVLSTHHSRHLLRTVQFLRQDNRSIPSN
jgi:hypothetical protein